MRLQAAASLVAVILSFQTVSEVQTQFLFRDSRFSSSQFTSRSGSSVVDQRHGEDVKLTLLETTTAATTTVDSRARFSSRFPIKDKPSLSIFQSINNFNQDDVKQVEDDEKIEDGRELFNSRQRFVFRPPLHQRTSAATSISGTSSSLLLDLNGVDYDDGTYSETQTSSSVSSESQSQQQGISEPKIEDENVENLSSSPSSEEVPSVSTSTTSSDVEVDLDSSTTSPFTISVVTENVDDEEEVIDNDDDELTTESSAISTIEITQTREASTTPSTVETDSTDNSSSEPSLDDVDPGFYSSSSSVDKTGTVDVMTVQPRIKNIKSKIMSSSSKPADDIGYIDDTGDLHLSDTTMHEVEEMMKDLVEDSMTGDGSDDELSMR